MEDVENGGPPLAGCTPPLAQLPCDQRQSGSKKQQRGWFGNKRLAATTSADRGIRGNIVAAVIRRVKRHRILSSIRPFIDVDAVTKTARMIHAAGVSTVVVLALAISACRKGRNTQARGDGEQMQRRLPCVALAS